MRSWHWTKRPANGSPYIYLSFPHNRYATDIALSYEASANLQTWTPLAAQLVSATITNFETEQMTVSIPAPGASYFVRVRATRP